MGDCRAMPRDRDGLAVLDLHGVDPALGDAVRLALLWLVPFPVLYGMTRFYSGELIRVRRTDIPAYAITTGIALSILAEIVDDRRSAERTEAVSVPAAPAPMVGIALETATDDLAIDPICGMSVSRDSPHRVESGGETWWFCCAGCAETFATAAQAADSA